MITKSKYMVSLECLNYLWYLENDKTKIKELSEHEKFVINQGYEVQKHAQKLLNGVEEKEFSFNDLYSRADIIKDNCVYEIKSSTSLKQEFIEDISFQKYVYEKSGNKFSKYFIVYLNKNYVKEGELDLNELFIIHEVKEFISFNEIENNIQNIRNLKFPSEKCKLANKCPVNCWDLKEGNVFELNRGGKISLRLYENNINFIKDIPLDYKLNLKQKIQRDCYINNEIYLDKDKIKIWLSKLKQPIYYFDFESFQTAIPKFNKTKCWQQIPFQFSCHKENEHFEFLYNGNEDPREELINALKCLGNEGSIVVYYKSFEISRLKELSEAFPEYKDYLNNLINRIVDLHDIFKNFYYYNIKQKNSTSIKKVLPCLSSINYDELNINNGSDASYKFYISHYLNEGNKQEIRKDLLEYCKLDTLAEIEIINELKKIVEK